MPQHSDLGEVIPVEVLLLVAVVVYLHEIEIAAAFLERYITDGLVEAEFELEIERVR